MVLSNPLKLIPSSYYLPLAIVGGALLAWRLVFSGKSVEATPTASSMGYDPSLVALGVSTSLEREKLNASTELGKLAMQTELQALDKEYAAQGVEIAANERISNKSIESNERVTSAALSLEHAKEGTLREAQAFNHAETMLDINTSANLANYQTLVQHDLGKKQLKTSTTNAVLGGVFSLFGK